MRFAAAFWLAAIVLLIALEIADCFGELEARVGDLERAWVIHRMKNVGTDDEI
jgi:hypothetical protein